MPTWSDTLSAREAGAAPGFFPTGANARPLEALDETGQPLDAEPVERTADVQPAPAAAPERVETAAVEPRPAMAAPPSPAVAAAAAANAAALTPGALVSNEDVTPQPSPLGHVPTGPWTSREWREAMREQLDRLDAEDDSERPDVDTGRQDDVSGQAPGTFAGDTFGGGE
jgi:hypothetical protein